MRDVLKKPIITEKSTSLTKENQYVFEVEKSATKGEIKREVEEKFGVDVLSVRIIKIAKKRRKLGRISGWKKGGKKAIIKIKKGQKIDLFPEHEKKS